VPIIALTANYSDEHRALCRQLGMQGFLSKPIRREELLEAIHANLGMAIPPASQRALTAS
jgi:CheY-like chemotaxis protein